MSEPNPGSTPTRQPIKTPRKQYHKLTREIASWIPIEKLAKNAERNSIIKLYQGRTGIVIFSIRIKIIQDKRLNVMPSRSAFHSRKLDLAEAAITITMIVVTISPARSIKSANTAIEERIELNGRMAIGGGTKAYTVRRNDSVATSMPSTESTHPRTIGKNPGPISSSVPM